MRLPLPLLFLLPALAVAQDTPSVPEDTRVHNGPVVPRGKEGPARHVKAVYERFDSAAAMVDIEAADQGFRAPGDEDFDATLERIAERLKAAGFKSNPLLRFEFQTDILEQGVWKPRSASLILRVGRTPPEVLHAFSHPSDVARTMLPINCPPADVEGVPVLELAEVAPGTILVTESRLSSSLLRRAEKRGAVAVLSSWLYPFTVDPTGQGRHQDAILLGKAPKGTSLPIAHISPRVRNRIQEAAEEGDAWLAYTAEVYFGGRHIRSLVAEVVGSKRPDEIVTMVSHAQEPGAEDNGSGIGGTTEAAVLLAKALLAGEMDWPARTVCFVWGDEMRQSRVYMRNNPRRVIAGLSADMLGASREKTGAIALLERAPDPGAVHPLPPDEHTPWGAGEVLAEDLKPHGLNVVMRTALVDVSRHVGGWTTSEHPWEGGSDHDVYLERGIPGVLVWHFTDFTYHTSLDRMDVLDPEELRRSCVAVMAALLALADPQEGDLERYLEANEIERELRVQVARQAGQEEIARLWESWCDGAAIWLRETCVPVQAR